MPESSESRLRRDKVRHPPKNELTASHPLWRMRPRSLPSWLRNAGDDGVALRMSEARIEPTAAQRKRSEGSFAVCCSKLRATGPSACTSGFVIARSVRFGIHARISKHQNYRLDSRTCISFPMAYIRSPRRQSRDSPDGEAVNFEISVCSWGLGSPRQVRLAIRRRLLTEP